MQFKKTLSVMLAVAVFFLTGCSNKAQTDTSSESEGEIVSAAEEISMIYNSKDSFNPYSCKTNQNRILTQLLFDSLVTLNNDYSPEFRIAESAEYNEKVLTVKLRNLKFSDGSDVASADVVFSFNTAKKSSSNYAASLKYASSATAVDASTVEFHLYRDDPYFINLLTFPIIKTDSDTLKDSDNRELPPIGCGRYILNIETKIITQNPYYTDSVSKVKAINLIDAPDSESVNQAVSNGAVDYYFTDLSDNVIPKMNGTSADVPQSRIVFLGVNSKGSIMSNTYLRQAVSAALNRDEICKSAYFSKATPAKGPFPSSWVETENYQTIETLPNSDTVVSNFNLAGYSKKSDDGYYLKKNGNELSLTLLVSNENSCRLSAAEIIEKNLEAVGIKVNLKSVSNESFKSLLKSGSYDIYLSEIRFQNNMDLGGLVSLDSATALMTAPDTSSLSSFNVSANVSSKQASNSVPSFSSSVTASNTASDSTEEDVPVITLTTKEAYKGFYSGIYTIQDVITAFSAELPVIPVCFRNGLIIYSEKLGSGISPNITDLFHGIEKLK